MRAADTSARLLAATALVAAVIAVLVVVRKAVGGDDTVAAAPVPPCRTAVPDDLEGRMTCRTPSARLTIADEDTPLLVGETQARVLRSRLDGRFVVVRLRLRPPPDDPRRARLGRGQVRLTVGGRRFEHAPLYGGRKPGRPVNATLRFRLGPKTAARLRRGDVDADLGIVPAGEIGKDRPAVLGVIRLDIP